MYDKGKILTGLVIFFGLLSFPFWYTTAKGKAGYVPELEKAVKGERCVLPVDEIRAGHMQLLNDWRDEAVRGGDWVFRSPEGTPYVKSLTNTCLDCHRSRKRFCDRCHDYMAVDPYCWNCHVAPDELEEGK